MRRAAFGICQIAIICILGCQRVDGAPNAQTVAQISAKVHAMLPHSRSAFTQGLAFWHGRLFEGTGLYGSSALRELDPVSGNEIRHLDLDRQYFGEGITVLDGRIYELTWKEHRCFVYDVDTFRKLEELSYEGDGWGLANDGSYLISSDGSAKISFRDRKTMAVMRSMTVLYEGEPVTNLNELEFVSGSIWANIWGTDSIVRIAASSGRVVEVLHTSAILPHGFRSSDPDDVLNGIAFDDRSGRFLITGKRWPHMFNISIK